MEPPVSVRPQVSGTFQCLDCQALVKDVPQQFKYSPPTICRNPVCNNRSRFHLDTHKSKFIDFQKVTLGRTSPLSGGWGLGEGGPGL